MRISDWSSDVCSSDLTRVVGKDPHLARGKGALQIVDHIFARREIDFEVGPFLGVQFGEPAIEDRFRGRDELENDRFALAEVVTDRRDHCRQLHAEKKLAEEALLCGLEAGRSEEHTSELQSLMRISYAVFCLKKNKQYE